MQLAQDRFYKSDTRFKGADGIVRDATVYSYETHNALYDVLMIEGYKFYRLNMGAPSNLICDIKPIHYEIERHFQV